MIAVADSGIGGLTLLKKLMEKYPKADFTYFADNAYAPYGSLNSDALSERVFSVTSALIKSGSAHVVLGCNTASTNCLTSLKSIYGYKISGVIPTVGSEPESTLIMCTPLTAKSKVVKEYVNVGAIVYISFSLASLVEKHRFNLAVLRDYLKAELSPFCPKKVVLGCTHYVFLKDIIEDILGVPTDDCYNGVINSLSNALKPSDYTESGKLMFKFSGKDETADYIELLHSIK